MGDNDFFLIDTAPITPNSTSIITKANMLADSPVAPSSARQYKMYLTVGPTNSDYITDGASDETQINQAITACNAAGGGKVFLSGLSYHVSLSPIVLKNNVSIQGLGMNKTVIYGDSTLGTNAVMLGTATISAPSTDLEFSDFTIDGTSMPSSPLSTFRKGIDCLYTLRWRLNNVRIYNTPATGLGPDCNIDLRAENCIMDSCGRSDGDPGYNGFGIGTGFYQNESCQLINCVAVNCYNNGFLFEHVGGGFNSKDYQLTNCYAIGCNRGFRVSGSQGVTYTNCKAIDSTNEGFYTITYSTGDYPCNVKIIGGDAYGNGANGVHFMEGEPLQINHLVQGVSSYNNAGHGICSGSNQLKVKDNYTYGNAKIGILYHAASGVAAANGQITGNTSYNNGTAAVLANQDGIRIWGESSAIDGLLLANNRCFDNQAIQTFSDGAITTGTATFTSSTANFLPSYVGESITINGAGVSGANLTTTIAAYNSATSVTVAVNASTTVSGATFSFGSNQTQVNGIVLKTNVTNSMIINNDVRGNLTSGLVDARTTTSDPSVQIKNNKGFNPEEIFSQGNVTGATTFNRINGNHIIATLTGNITITLSGGAQSGDTLTLELIQDGTGSRTVTWPSNFKKAGGSLNLSTGASAKDIINMKFDTTNWVETGRALNIS